MAKRAGFWLVLCLVIFACLQSVGCTGVPVLFHAVALTPSTPQTIGSGTTLLITAAVSNDTSGAGVTWGTPAHGILSAVTTTSATYNAPVVAAGQSVADAVTATSITFPGQSKSLSITVQGAPLISTLSLPSGNWGSPYNATVTGTGGVPPFVWSISAGALTTGLSLGASTTRTVTISGTPGAQLNSNFTIKMTDSTGAFATQPLTIAIGAPLPLQVTTTTLPNGALNVAYPPTTLQASGGVPPFTWILTTAPATFPTGLSLAPNGTITGTPTAAGTFNFSVKVTDSQPVPATAPAGLSITVNDLGPLNGNYAFEFSGFDSSGRGVVIAGSFTADGFGNLTNGVEDFNTIAGPPANQTFTGTYTLGNDGRGQLAFSSLAGSPTYAFAIDLTGSHGRLIEFDASGVRGSGRLEKRSVSTCASNTMNGDYAFGITGNAVAGVSPAGPVAMAGRLTATPPVIAGTQGSLDSGELDANTPGFVTLSPATVSGTFQTTSQTTRCTMNVSPSSLASMTFSVYPISATESFLVETDTVNSTTPFLTVGKMRQQFGSPFNTAGVFTGTSVAGFDGQILSFGTYLPDVAIARISAGGGGSFTMSVWENQAGTTGNYGGPFSVNYTVDTLGRVTTNLIHPFSPVLYMIDSNDAFCVGMLLNGPMFATFESQSAGPFPASAINGSFALGTAAPATNAVPNFSGAVTLANTTATAGTINGAQDTSTSSGNTAGQTVTGTYSIADQVAGAGTFTLTAPAAFTGQFFIISPTKLAMISTTNGDANPVLIFLGN